MRVFLLGSVRFESYFGNFCHKVFIGENFPFEFFTNYFVAGQPTISSLTKYA